MESQSPSRVSSVEPYYQNGGRDDSKECDCCNYSVSSNEITILGLFRETVSHACPALVRFRVGPVCACAIPLYRIVAKFNPTRFGNRNVFLVESHVPSPTVIEFEE